MGSYPRLSNRGLGVLCGLASALIWGAFPVLTRQGVTHSSLDAYDITCIRYGVSGLILLPFLLRRGLQGLDWKTVALLVAGIDAPYMLVVAQGLARAPVQQFALVTPGSMILFASLIGTCCFGQPMPLRDATGIGLILSGMMVAGWHDLSMPQGTPATYLIFLGGGALWAIYTVTARQRSVSPLHATALVSVFSLLLYLPPYFHLRGLALFSTASHELVVQALYQGVLVSIVALFFYSKAVQLLGAASGASFAALVPLTSTLLAALMLGEYPAYSMLPGLLLVSLGMLFTLLPQRRTRSRQLPATHLAEDERP